MKTTTGPHTIFLGAALALSAVGLPSDATAAAKPPKMKMTTPVPEGVATPDNTIRRGLHGRGGKSLRRQQDLQGDPARSSAGEGLLVLHPLGGHMDGTQNRKLKFDSDALEEVNLESP